MSADVSIGAPINASGHLILHMAPLVDACGGPVSAEFAGTIT
jgi:hypothetical protein